MQWNTFQIHVQEAALIRLQAEQGGLEVQRDEAARATQHMELILKGLDLAFLFDVTGSMVTASFLSEVSEDRMRVLNGCPQHSCPILT